MYDWKYNCISLTLLIKHWTHGYTAGMKFVFLKTFASTIIINVTMYVPLFYERSNKRFPLRANIVMSSKKEKR